ncbi:MAG: carbohydrate ABC transporter permease [Tyzzerella sp.]|nr:carbohydrate ABC transporter permease [Tyzzerella sp.]
MKIDKYKLKRKTTQTIWSLFRTILIFGLCFVILYPFLVKLLATFMSSEDLLDSTVKFVPKNWSLDYWKFAWERLDIANSGTLSVFLSLGSALIQMMVSTMVGYGLARFRFKGRNFAFMVVIIMLLVPTQVYSIPQYLNFRYFGVGDLTVNLIDNVIPVFLLSLGCLSVKQCLYIYLMREFFKDLPRDLENAAYIDGASIARTFTTIVLPNAKNMMLTVFLFAFCWQWTDTEFSSLYFSSKTTLAMRPLVGSYMVVKGQVTSTDPLGTAIARAAATFIIIIPVVILSTYCQKFLVKSISRSGMAN